MFNELIQTNFKIKKIAEVVYIGAVNPWHFPVGKMMLNAGKHVLCETTLTLNARQSRELIELARSKGLFLMEGIWSRCFPTYEILKQEIDEGTIGEVKQVYVNFGFRFPQENRLK